MVPKPGKAILWQNVVDGDFDLSDHLTRHVAEDVGPGLEKFSANVWAHTGDVRSYLLAMCYELFKVRVKNLRMSGMDVYASSKGIQNRTIRLRELEAQLESRKAKRKRRRR